MPQLVLKTSEPSIGYAPPQRPEAIIIAFQDLRSSQGRGSNLMPLLLGGLIVGMLALGSAALWLLKEQTMPPAPAPPLLAAVPMVPENLNIVPLPEKAIMGRDFNDGKDAAKDNTQPAPVSLLPLLQNLPMGSPDPRVAPPTRQPPYTITVGAAPARSLLDSAERAALNGDIDEAIRLYGQLRRANPHDGVARYNLAALLLDKGAYFDGQKMADKAIVSYQQALDIWSGDAAIAAGIRARIAYLQARLK